jgi:hypothetical protein
MLHLFFLITLCAFVFLSIFSGDNISMLFIVFIGLNIAFYGYFYVYSLIKLTFFLKKEYPDIYKKNKGFSSYKGTQLLTPLILLKTKEIRENESTYFKNLRTAILFFFITFLFFFLGTLLLVMH